MSGRSQPFDPKVVLGLLLFGALAFLATLYLIGAGETGRNANNGQAHAASKGITGFAGLVAMLKADGHEVRVSRSAAAHDDEALLVLTPPLYADADDIADLIDKRRYVGPTLVILPKWQTARLSREARAKTKAKEGWVELGEADVPRWTGDLDGDLAMTVETGRLEGGSHDWKGFGRTGRLPDRAHVSVIRDGRLTPLVVDKDGDILSGYLDDGGYYPVLDEAAGMDAANPDDLDSDRWGVVVVAEPDLLDNYALADRARAELAHELVDTAMEGEDLPVVFDLTLNGLGRTQNLLTLAFTPPFLAATLCLILAMLVAGWRAFRRFGPPVPEAPAIAFGKRQLVANSAGLIQRARRLHLLAEPYAALMRARIAAALGLEWADDAALDAALARRLPDEVPYSQRAATLGRANRPAEILRAAHALKSLERKLAK